LGLRPRIPKYASIESPCTARTRIVRVSIECTFRESPLGATRPAQDPGLAKKKIQRAANQGKFRTQGALAARRART
jgi:hypothetical protein